MAAWVDIFSLILVRPSFTCSSPHDETEISPFLQTTFVFVGSILGAVYLVRKISAYVTRTKESLKQKGWTISEKGVSVKTSGRMNREDYLDATQRGLIKAMGASHHGVDHTISASNSPNTSPAATYKAPAPVRRASASSVHTAGSDSGSGNGNGNGEKHRGLFSRKWMCVLGAADGGRGFSWAVTGYMKIQLVALDVRGITYVRASPSSAERVGPRLRVGRGLASTVRGCAECEDLL
ncbi:hypothetical protein DENSPDRAFT_270067 [Dentipellis sp. KUC8613]|nr:hypothetical protein DENSPDRAFT_270067 [Dentipellis sp. KUC8613]